MTESLIKTTLEVINHIFRNHSEIRNLIYTSLAADAYPKLTKRFSDEELFTTFQHREVNLHPSNFTAQQVYLVTDLTINPPALESAVKVRTIKHLTPEEIGNGIFYVYFSNDEDAIAEIKHINDGNGKYIPHLHFGKTQYRFTDKKCMSAIATSHENRGHIGEFDTGVHENICEALKLTKHLPGSFVEFGVFRGASAHTALTYLHLLETNDTNNRPLAYLVDTFDGFTYVEAETSADTIWKNTHRLSGPSETIRAIEALLSTIGYPFVLIRANVCNMQLPDELEAIRVCNIDVDMYEPTIAALKLVAPKIPLGGIIICEDPTGTPALYGALLAMEEFLNLNEGKKFIKLFKGAQYFLLKVSE